VGGLLHVAHPNVAYRGGHINNTLNLPIHEEKSTCHVGYRGLMCGVCDDSYYVGPDGTCTVCIIGGKGQYEYAQQLYMCVRVGGYE
jgi:hypothetical protein